MLILKKIVSISTSIECKKIETSKPSNWFSKSGDIDWAWKILIQETCYLSSETKTNLSSFLAWKIGVLVVNKWRVFHLKKKCLLLVPQHVQILHLFTRQAIIIWARINYSSLTCLFQLYLAFALVCLIISKAASYLKKAFITL